MTNNPVRSASDEAAKEVSKSFAELCDKETREKVYADIIESKLAPVVAAAAEGAPCHPASCRDEMLWRETITAAEEAMKEKIRRAVKKELEFIIHQEKVRVSGKYTEKFAAKDIAPEEVSSYCSPTSIAWENAQTILEVAIRAILAETKRR